MKAVCYFNGDFVKFEDIKISPKDLGFARGYGIFDAMRTANKKPFLLDAHWERLESSAENLNIRMPISKDDFKSIIKRLLKENNFEAMSIKTVLSGGIAQNGITMEDDPTLLIIVDDLSFFSPAREAVENGIRAITLEFKRFLPEVKSLNYMAAIKEQRRKENYGAQEIIYMDSGRILEGSTSNIFVVKGEKVATADKDILKGTVRNFILELSKDHGWDIEERAIGTEDLFSADEVFATGSYKGILPIVNVDGKDVGSGKVGRMTGEIMEVFNKNLEKY
ncbi:MAG: aminotransferase class IV [Candidatus Moranbacteria bacterium]|jgi:D-amino acid aminotransferase|nr:aminotransferase class IV [Candidatus Moranbacteria bacterium]MDX9855612.1 aminotransferase class IV [Candidatus Moranbacteria bacterium]